MVKFLILFLNSFTYYFYIKLHLLWVCHNNVIILLIFSSSIILNPSQRVPRMNYHTKKEPILIEHRCSSKTRLLWHELEPKLMNLDLLGILVMGYLISNFPFIYILNNYHINSKIAPFENIISKLWIEVGVILPRPNRFRLPI